MRNSSNIKQKKRGRPKVKNVLREPNGRISRAKNNACFDAVKIRAQKYNLTFEQAKNPRSHSWVGRLTFVDADKGLSEAQYIAAIAYWNLYKKYQKAILSPGAHYESCLHQSRYYGEEEQTRWCRQICDSYERVKKLITEHQNQHPNENLYAALQYGVLDDIEVPQLLGSLRIALNILHHHFFASQIHKQKKTKPISLAIGRSYTPISQSLAL